MTWDRDNLNAPHTEREIAMIEDRGTSNISEIDNAPGWWVNEYGHRIFVGGGATEAGMKWLRDHAKQVGGYASDNVLNPMPDSHAAPNAAARIMMLTHERDTARAERDKALSEVLRLRAIVDQA